LTATAKNVSFPHNLGEGDCMQGGIYTRQKCPICRSLLNKRVEVATPKGEP